MASEIIYYTGEEIMTQYRRLTDRRTDRYVALAKTRASFG